MQTYHDSLQCRSPRSQSYLGVMMCFSVSAESRSTLDVTAGSALGCVTDYTRLHHLCFWSLCSNFTSDPLRNQQQLGTKVRPSRSLSAFDTGGFSLNHLESAFKWQKESKSIKSKKKKKTLLEVWLWSTSCDLRSRGRSEGNHLRFIRIRLFNHSGSKIIRSKTWIEYSKYNVKIMPSVVQSFMCKTFTVVTIQTKKN